MSRSSLALRAAGATLVSAIFFLEGGCSSGRPSRVSTGAEAEAPLSSPSKENLSSILSAYEAGRLKAWDPSRRFKALFKAEVSPKVGAIGRGYLSVWWDGASGELTWRTSAPIGGAGRGGFLRVKEGGRDAAAGENGPPLSARLAAPDVVSCLLGTPDAQATPAFPFEETPRGLRLRIDSSKRSVLLDEHGKPVELSFPGGEVVMLQPGEGVPRRIEARGPDGRAILTLESYAPWPASEPIPPL